MTVIEKLDKLYEDFYKTCGKVYHNQELLGELYEPMMKDIEDVYKLEGKLLMRAAKIEYEAASYELDCKEDLLLPGRCGLFWRKKNEPADIIYREVAAKAYDMFDKRTEALEKLEAALKKAEQTARPDDEPEEPLELEQKHVQTDPRAIVYGEPPEEPQEIVQKPALNGEKQEPVKTDEPTAKPPENATEPAQNGEPAVADFTLSAKKAADKPQPRKDSKGK